MLPLIAPECRQHAHQLVFISIKHAVESDCTHREHFIVVDTNVCTLDSTLPLPPPHHSLHAHPHLHWQGEKNLYQQTRGENDETRFADIRNYPL